MEENTMAKRLTMFSLRLLLLIIVADVLAAILMGIENVAVQWGIDILLTLSLWVFVWMDAVSYGQKDFKKDKLIKNRVEETGCKPEGEEGRMFKPWFGFVAGLIAQIPAFLLMLGIIFTNDSVRVILTPLLNLWNLSNIHILLSVSGFLVFAYVVPPILFAVVSGLGYMNGPAQQKRLEIIIERNKTKKARRVQDDLKKKQKKGQNRKNY
jgi:hypothetical protein